jgi:hypothetical protein
MTSFGAHLPAEGSMPPFTGHEPRLAADADVHTMAPTTRT